MKISKLFKSQSLVIIFAAASSLGAKPQSSTSEGNSPRRKKNHGARTVRKYGSRAQQSLWVSIYFFSFPLAFILLCLGFFLFFQVLKVNAINARKFILRWTQKLLQKVPSGWIQLKKEYYLDYLRHLSARTRSAALNSKRRSKSFGNRDAIETGRSRE